MAKGYQVEFRNPRSGSVTVEIGPGRLAVGRLNSGADIEVDDRGVSSRHGALWSDPQGVWYEDLGSSNGSWLGQEKLNGPTRLSTDTEVLLGETTLTLKPTQIELPPGMKLSLLGKVGSRGLTEAMAQRAESGAYLTALYGLTEGLLRGDSLEFIPEALQRVSEAVPLARQMAVVAWPPESDGSLRQIAGSASGAFSSSMARYAVEQGRAIMLTSGELPPQLANAPSIRLRGIRSSVYVPLESDNAEEILGLLCVDSMIPLLELDFQFLCAVAGLLASKLASERLRQQANQEALQRQHQQSRREALASFLQIASHDLKNPLTAIENCGRLLRRLPPEKQGPTIDILLGASGRATDLIRTYLDAAAVESGKPLQVDWEDLDVSALVNEETEFLRAAFHGQMDHVRVVNLIAEPCLRADSRKLRQVFCNLLTNAIKYSPQGGDVVISREGNRFSVKDQGVGIAHENLPKLFAAFERVGDRSIATGTGLGLWLTAALVHAHDGEIGVESTPGQGSTFWFSIPPPV